MQVPCLRKQHDQTHQGESSSCAAYRTEQETHSLEASQPANPQLEKHMKPQVKTQNFQVHMHQGKKKVHLEHNVTLSPRVAMNDSQRPTHPYSKTQANYKKCNQPEEQQ